MDAEVIIIGGGLAGFSLAGLLAREGVDSLVVEAAEKSDKAKVVAADPRALAITRASRSILDSFGAWRQLPEDRSGCFRAMHVWDANGDGEIDFDSADLCQPDLGYIIEQAVLQACIEQVIDAMPNISVYYDKKIRFMEHHENTISVTLDSGESLSAKLVVGADGAASASRTLAGIKSVVHDYRQRAVACLVETALAHDHIARQRFLDHGPLAFLPMHSAFQCGVVWSTSPEHASVLMDMEETVFNASLQEAIDHSLGQIVHSERRACFPLRGAQADHYCRQRFALIGDAAHSVHPLAGQGANLGLLDAASLAQLILQAKTRGRDIGSQRVLRAYERWRKGENSLMMTIMEVFKYSFENQSFPIPMLRNKALNMANSIVPLKHTIMRHAMGLSGDLPDVAKGNFV